MNLLFRHVGLFLFAALLLSGAIQGIESKGKDLDLGDSGFILKSHFKAYQGSVFVYDFDFTVRHATYKSREGIEVHTVISGEGVSENNLCFLSQDHRVIYILQSTENKNKNEKFKWEIDSAGDKSTSLFHDFVTEKTVLGEFAFPPNGYPIQALLFLMRQVELGPNTQKDFNLLVPPYTFFDIYCKVVGNERIRYEEEWVDCYRIEIGLSGILGWFSPKNYLWISVRKPRLCLRAKNPEETLYLMSELSELKR